MYTQTFNKLLFDIDINFLRNGNIDGRSRVVAIGILISSHSRQPVCNEEENDHYDENDAYEDSHHPDRKSTRLNSSHIQKSRMPSSA